MVLELATSVTRLNNLRHYWLRSALLRNDLSKATISRYQFLQIRACLQLYPTYELDVANVYAPTLALMVPCETLSMKFCSDGGTYRSALVG